MQLTRSQCKVGMKVRFWYPSNAYCRHIHNTIGIITELGVFDVLVRFKGNNGSRGQELWCALQYLRSVELTPEEQEQADREAHAEKYL